MIYCSMEECPQFVGPSVILLRVVAQRESKIYFLFIVVNSNRNMYIRIVLSALSNLEISDICIS